MKNALDQANLLSGVRNDIEQVVIVSLMVRLINHSCSAYKSSAADSLLAERGRIDSSHRMTDDIIEYVYKPLDMCAFRLSNRADKLAKHDLNSLDNGCRWLESMHG